MPEAENNGDSNTNQETENTESTETTETTETTEQNADATAADILKAKNDLAAAQKRIRELEQEKLRSTGDYKKLYEQEKTRAEELDTKLKRNTQAFIDVQKRAVIKDALVKAGMRNDALKLVDQANMESVVVDTDDGSFKVLGVDSFVSKYKSEYPFMFSKDAGTINTGGTGGGKGGGQGQSSGKVTSAGELYQVERKFGVKSPEYSAAMQSYMEHKRKAANP